MARRLVQILAVLTLVACFTALTSESRCASFSTDLAHQQIASSTKLIEWRPVAVVPSLQPIPHFEIRPPVPFEVLPRAEVHPLRALFIAPGNFFRPPPIH